MSDGLTDAHRSTLAAERRRMLFRSVVDCLQDWDDEAKRSTAVNDIMAFEKKLYSVDGTTSRGFAARGFLDDLRRNHSLAWGQILAFALTDGADSEFRGLKDLSPFKDKTLIITRNFGRQVQISNNLDLVAGLERQNLVRQRYPTNDTKLVVLDISVSAVLGVKP